VVPEEERQQQQPSSLKDPWCTLQIELNETTGEAHVSLSLSNTHTRLRKAHEAEKDLVWL